MITEKDVERLAGLARVAVPESERGALVSDLEKILKHFEDLQAVPKIKDKGLRIKEPSVRFTTRGDDDSVRVPSSREKLVAAFPERDGDYLRVPAVFE